MTEAYWPAARVRLRSVSWPAGSGILNVMLLYVALGSASAVAARLHTAAIAAFAIATVTLGALACMLFGSERQRALTLFLSGYLARLAAATLNWFSERHGGVWIARFATDGQGNFELSQQPIPFDFTAINSPLWLMYNRAVTVISEHLGGAHVLANLQAQLVVASLIAPIVYTLANRFGLRRSARWTAWLLVLHPMLIAYSSALIRDETVSMFGFAALLFATDAVALRRHAAWYWMSVVGALIVVAMLRGTSALYFAAACGLLVLTLRKRQPTRMLVAVIAIVSLVTLAAVYTGSLSYFRTERFQDQVQGRHNDAGVRVPSGIAEAALFGGSKIWLPAIFSLHFIAPFPFFRVMEASSHPSFLHYCLGLGALFNQVLLGFFIAGTLIAFHYRNRALVASALAVTAFAIGSTLLLGDPSRYMSAHGAPLVVLIAVYGFRRLGAMRAVYGLAWVALLGAMHTVYWIVKARYGA